MDTSRLARATTLILSPCLPYLLRPSKLTEEAATRQFGAETWGTTQRLWSKLRPGIAQRHGVMDAAWAVAASPDEQTLAELNRQFRLFFEENADYAEKAASHITTSGLGHLLETDEVEVSPDAFAQTEPGAPVAGAPGHAAGPMTGPACSVCGRQDETLRVVAYPYVVSLLVVTLRRAFSGLWCRRHASLRQVLAAAVSATLGWLGIPFGWLYTPQALVTLATGGNQPPDLNFQLLRDVATHKLRQHDPEGAIRCLEEALKFRIDEAVETQLVNLYAEHGMPRPAAVRRQLLPFTLTLLGAALLGLLVGIIDYLFTIAFGSAFPGGVGLLLGILSWAPLVAMAFAGGLLLSQRLEHVLTRAQTRQRLLAVSLAVLSALLLAYGISTGTAVIDAVLGGPWSFMSISDAIYYAAQVLVTGGGHYITFELASGQLVGQIYVTILAVSAAFYLFVGINMSSAIVSWQRSVARIRAKASATIPSASVLGWLPVVGATLLMLGGAFWFLLSGSSSYGDPEVLAHTDEGFALLGQDEMDEAIVEFEAAIDIDPEASIAYIGLGLSHLDQHACEEAIADFDTSLRYSSGAPDEYTSLIHDGLGQAYYCLDDTEQAEQEFQQGLALNPTSSNLWMEMGILRFYQGNFDQAVENIEMAVELDPQWSAPHAFLAATYYQLDQEDAMNDSLQRAQELESDDPSDSYALGWLHWEMNEFATAEKYLLHSSELAPNRGTTHTLLASVYAAQGKFDLASQAADRALEINPASVDGLLAQANVHIYQEELDRAIEILDSALSIDPDNSPVHSLLSYAYFHDGQIDEALAEAQEAARLDPYNVAAHTEQAFAYHAGGDLDKAQQAALEAIRLAPKSDRPHYILALCYMDTGLTDEAIAEFETFLDLTWDRAYVRDFRVQAEQHLADLRSQN